MRGEKKPLKTKPKLLWDKSRMSPDWKHPKSQDASMTGLTCSTHTHTHIVATVLLSVNKREVSVERSLVWFLFQLCHLPCHSQTAVVHSWVTSALIPLSRMTNQNARDRSFVNHYHVTETAVVSSKVSRPETRRGERRRTKSDSSNRCAVLGESSTELKDFVVALKMS